MLYQPKITKIETHLVKYYKNMKRYDNISFTQKYIWQSNVKISASDVSVRSSSRLSRLHYKISETLLCKINNKDIDCVVFVESFKKKKYLNRFSVND